MRVVCLYEYDELSDDAKQRIALRFFRSEGARYLQTLTEDSTADSLEDDLHGFVQLFTDDDLLATLAGHGELFLWDGTEQIMPIAMLNHMESESDCEGSFERQTMVFCTDEDVKRMLRTRYLMDSTANVDAVKACAAFDMQMPLESTKYKVLDEIIDDLLLSGKLEKAK